MAENTAIGWADDTVNFWWGCTERGPECANCYAREGYPVAVAESQTGLRLWASNRKSGDPPAVRLKIESAADTLRRIDRKAAREGRPRLVFINSQSDFFEATDAAIVRRLPRRIAQETGETYDVAARVNGGLQWVSPESAAQHDPWTLDDERREAFKAIDECQNIRALLLTKRPENVLDAVPPRRCGFCGGTGLHASSAGFSGSGCQECESTGSTRYRDNVWIGTTCGAPASLDRVHALATLRGLTPVLFVSGEPLVGALDFSPWLGRFGDFRRIDWIIVGVESDGPRVGSLGAFPDREAWRSAAAEIVHQCLTAGVSVFVKQTPVGNRVSHDPAEWPPSLRFQQFPDRG